MSVFGKQVNIQNIVCYLSIGKGHFGTHQRSAFQDQMSMGIMDEKLPWHPNDDEKIEMLIKSHYLHGHPTSLVVYPNILTTSCAMNFGPFSRHSSRVKLDEIKCFRLLCETL